MDKWSDHLKFGLAFEVPFIVVMFFVYGWFKVTDYTDIYTYIYYFELLVLLMISPLVIDLDHRLGKLREGLAFIGLIIGFIGLIGYLIGLDLVILMVMGLAIASPSFLLYYITNHRGFVHSIPFCLIYSVCIYLILSSLDLAVLGLIGCYTHLVADKLFIKFW